MRYKGWHRVDAGEVGLPPLSGCILYPILCPLQVSLQSWDPGGGILVSGSLSSTITGREHRLLPRGHLQTCLPAPRQGERQSWTGWAGEVGIKFVCLCSLRTLTNALMKPKTSWSHAILLSPEGSDYNILLLEGKLEIISPVLSNL